MNNNSKQLQFDWDKRTDFHHHLERCAAMVATWPLWKQNILVQSGSPTVSTPRTPIVYDKEYGDKEYGDNEYGDNGPPVYGDNGPPVYGDRR